MSVDSLLNFNGTNNSQVFTDDGLNPSTWNIKSGVPILSTTNMKFGSSSLYLDGSSAIDTVIPAPLGPNATVEFYFHTDLYDYPTTYTALIVFRGSRDIGVYLYEDPPNKPRIIFWSNGRKIEMQRRPEVGSWNHLALIIDNYNLSLCLNGILEPKYYMFDDTEKTWLDTIYLGQSGIGEYFTGYIDSFRISRDEILYNVLSRPGDVPSSELTTTATQPPTMPSIHVDATPVFKTIQTNAIRTYSGSVIIGDSQSSETTGPPTSTNIVSGNVKKLGLPFGAPVVCVSLGLNAEVVGSGRSDPVTGDYSIDVYPHTSEVLIYVAPDYGQNFPPSGFVGKDTIIHPTIPNRNVYIALNDGIVDSVEPPWPDSGSITSGGVTFNTLPLHKPLMNGFIKPVITPL